MASSGHRWAAIQHCPAGHALALIGDRWSLMIVREALRGADRYDGFRLALGVSDNTLSRRLAHLQEIDVLRHTPNGTYELTDAGAALADVLAVLGAWGDRWLDVASPQLEPPEPVVAAAKRLGLRPSSARRRVQANAGALSHGRSAQP
jgi:DNA-binding HxlR family transcriptional regulator